MQQNIAADADIKNTLEAEEGKIAAEKAKHSAEEAKESEKGLANFKLAHI